MLTPTISQTYQILTDERFIWIVKLGLGEIQSTSQMPQL